MKINSWRLKTSGNLSRFCFGPSDVVTEFVRQFHYSVHRVCSSIPLLASIIQHVFGSFLYVTTCATCTWMIFASQSMFSCRTSVPDPVDLISSWRWETNNNKFSERSHLNHLDMTLFKHLRLITINYTVSYDNRTDSVEFKLGFESLADGKCFKRFTGQLRETSDCQLCFRCFRLKLGQTFKLANKLGLKLQRSLATLVTLVTQSPTLNPQPSQLSHLSQL